MPNVRSRIPFFFATCSSLALFAHLAVGQTNPVASAPSPSSSSPIFQPPQINDSRLNPVPPAEVQISNWREAVSYLHSRSTDLNLALLEIARAEGQSRVALAGALPTITASGSATRNLIRGEVPSVFPGIPATTQPVAGLYGANLTITQPLLALRAWHAMGTAELSQEIARMNVDAKKRTIAIAVSTNIMAVVAAERSSEISRVGLQSALELSQLTRRRAELGAANALDVLRTDQDTAAASAQVISSDESLRKTREALGLSLGLPQPVGVAKGISLDDLQRSALQACPAAASLNERADLRAAQRQTEIQQRAVKDVWLQFAPTVNLVSRTDVSSELYSNQKHMTWSIAGVLTIPLWEGGARYGLLRDTRAQQEQSELRLQSAQRAATVEIAQAQRFVEVTQQARSVASQSSELAKESYRLARISFEMGKTTSFELIDAGRRLREAELALAVKEFEEVQARLAALLSLSSCSW